MDVFQALGMALVFSAACWLALRRPTQHGGLLFAKLVGVFLAIHLGAALIHPGGVNPVVTALATYAVGRWVLLRTRAG